jgi:hypothetical protein
MQLIQHLLTVVFRCLLNGELLGGGLAASAGRSLRLRLLAVCRVA